MKKLATLLVIAMIGLTACEKENTSVEAAVAETITAMETTVETKAITTTEATTTTTAEAVTTTISETKTTVEEVNYNTDYVETAERLFYALEGTTDSTTNNIKIYADDMNDDGVVEILCCKSTLGMGITDMYIFDVATGKTNTLDMGQTIKGFFAYTTDEGTVHYLIRKSFWTSADRGNIDFYDITYTENQFKVKIPLHLEIDPWYDNRALVCDIKARTGCTFDIETQRYNMDNATELGVICQTEDLDWNTESIYGEDIEAVTKLIDEYVVKDMQLEYELELVAEVERLENGEYEKAWEEIAPVIQELYPVEGDNVVDDTATATGTQIVDLPAFIAEKHDLTCRVINDTMYSTTVYSINDFILVEEGTFHGVARIPELQYFMYNGDGVLLFENWSMYNSVKPENIWFTEMNGTTLIIIETCQAKQSAIYKYVITESGVTETVCDNATETDSEITYYVTIDGEEKVLYKVVHTDEGWEADYSVSELSFAEVTEVYNAYTASN